jgi:hypothetical protein
MPSEDGQLTETCKDGKYLQTKSHWTVLTIINNLMHKYTAYFRKVWLGTFPPVAIS